MHMDILYPKFACPMIDLAIKQNLITHLYSGHLSLADYRSVSTAWNQAFHHYTIPPTMQWSSREVKHQTIHKHCQARNTQNKQTH